MAGPRYIDRVRETCAAPGTGTVMLSGAVLAYQPFASKLTDGDTCFVTIADQAGPNWEVSLATYHAGGTLARSAGNVLDGSSGPGVLVNFSSGVQDVFLDAPATLFPAGSLSLVPASRQVNAGTGLSGGGSLDNNVTISLPNTGTAGTFGDGTHTVQFSTDAQGRVTAAATSATALCVAARQVLAGSGLTGGGVLTADVTIALPNVGTAGTYGSGTLIPILTTDAQGRVTGVGAANPALSIGQGVSGSGIGRVLYVDLSGALASGSNFTFDPGGQLTVTDADGRQSRFGRAGTGSDAASFTDGVRAVELVTASKAGHFSDGIRDVDLCDGTNHVTYIPGAGSSWSSPPSDVWVALDLLSGAVASGGSGNPLTTKGDLFGYSTVAARVPVGTNGQVLTADSTQTLGLKWATPTVYLADPTTTKGDLIVHGSTTTRLAVGTDGQVLTADSTQAAGVKWGAAGGGGSANSRGAYGSRPAAATAGAGSVYLATDGPLVSESNGSTWAVFGPVFPLTDPLAPSWAWQDQTSNSVTATLSTSGGAPCISAVAGSVDNIHARVIALPAAGTAYTVTALIQVFGINTGGLEGGLCLTDGTKYIVFMCQQTRMGVRKYTNATTFSANYTFLNAGTDNLIWFRIADAGGSATNAVTFQVSMDGVNWATVVTRNRADFLTESKIGFYLNANNNAITGMAGMVTLYSWSGP